jgi:hypothetical protein
VNERTDVTEPEFEVPIQLLEELLGRPFLPEHLAGNILGYDDLERIYHALYGYHTRNRIQPVESTDTVRPNLSFVADPSGVAIERDVHPYSKGSYLPRNGQLNIPIDDIKRTLLFADAVVIEDPIFAFCRAVVCSSSHDYVHLHLLEDLIRELAGLRPLLEQRLLRVTAYFPEPVEGFDGDLAYSDIGTSAGSYHDYADERVLRLIFSDDRLKALSTAGVEERARIIEQLEVEEPDLHWLYQQAQSIRFGILDHAAYCPHLPNDYQYDLFHKLLSRNTVRVPTLDVRTLMELTSGCAPDPDKIQVAELLDIRRNGEVFSDWRELIRASIAMATLRKNDRETQLLLLKEEVKNRAREWRAKFQKFNKGRLADVVTLSKEISIGGVKSVATSHAGSLLDASGLLSFGSLFYGLYKAARKIEDGVNRRASEAAALSFFTAIRDTTRN